MQRINAGIRVFLLSMPLTALALSFAYQRERASLVLEDGEKAFQENSVTYGKSAKLSRAVLKESVTIGRLISRQADPNEWTREKIADLAIHIVLKSREYKLSPYLVLSLIHVESSFRTGAVSPKGAVGLMQLMPATAAELALVSGLPFRGTASLRDPMLNVELGLRYMVQLKVLFPSDEHVLTAYNIGPNALAKKIRNGERLPLSYYQKVMDRMELFRREAHPELAATTQWL